MIYNSVQEEANDIKKQGCQGVAKLDEGGSFVRGRRKKVSILDKLTQRRPASLVHVIALCIRSEQGQLWSFTI